MGPDLIVVENSRHHLQVISPRMFFWWGTLCALAFDAVTTTFVLKTLPTRSTGVRGGIVFASVAITIVLFLTLGWTNILEINWDSGEVKTTNRSLLGFSTSHTLRTSEIDQAYIDLDRMGPRIAFHLREGGDVLPLGRISMYKLNQYFVMEAINDRLQDHTPATARTPGVDTGTQGLQMEAVQTGH